MKILAVENSFSAASVAVAEGGRILGLRRFDSPRGRGTGLFTVLEEMRPLWRGADRLAVGLGPGSYNGVRAACALAGAFQLALGLDVVTAPSCCLLDHGDGTYLAVGDARGGRLWRAEVRGRRLAGDILLLSPEELAREKDRHDGPVCRVGSVCGFEDWPAAAPDAAVLAVLAEHLVPADPSALAPLYLKPPHITAPKARGA